MLILPHGVLLSADEREKPAALVAVANLGAGPQADGASASAAVRGDTGGENRNEHERPPPVYRASATPEPVEPISPNKLRRYASLIAWAFRRGRGPGGIPMT